MHGLAEAALDVTVRSAVRDPLRVETVDDAVRLLRAHEAPDPKGPVGMAIAWLSARWATRVLRVGRRYSIPVRTVLTVAPPILQAIRHNAYEMQVLASLLVRRLRTAGVPVDARLVRRVVVAAYPDPDADEFPAERTAPVGRLVSAWATRALHPQSDRAERAARRVAALDLAEIRIRSAALDV
jgi:hypothetical protein